MSPLRSTIAATAGAAAPRGSYVRARFRVSLDTLLTVGVAILALALVVGFQVLSRLDPSRFDRSE